MRIKMKKILFIIVLTLCVLPTEAQKEIELDSYYFSRYPHTYLRFFEKYHATKIKEQRDTFYRSNYTADTHSNVSFYTDGKGNWSIGKGKTVNGKEEYDPNFDISKIDSVSTKQLPSLAWINRDSYSGEKTWDDTYTYEDAERASSIIISGKDVKYCTEEIGFFPNVSTIEIQDYDSIDCINLSNATKLECLKIHNQDDVYRDGHYHLAELNLDGCKSLRKISLQNSAIKRLVNLSNKDSLRSVTIHGKCCDSIDVSTCPKLENLDANYDYVAHEYFYNQTKYLNISNSNLKTLYCFGDCLEYLDASNSPKLLVVKCSGNKLKFLNLNNCPKLSGLSCSGNKLTSLDVTAFSNLMGLSCDSNQLTSLDVSKNIWLEKLTCSKNALKSLDLKDVKYLKKLDCHNNLLSTLDISINESLENLDCHDNQITILNIMHNTNLKSLCSGNKKEAILTRIFCPQWMMSSDIFKGYFHLYLGTY